MCVCVQEQEVSDGPAMSSVASGLGTHISSGAHEPVVSRRRLCLRCLQQRTHLAPAVLEQATLSGQRDRFVQALAIAQMVAQFVVGGAEARRCLEGAETTHRVVTLFDAPMVLLDAVVHVPAGPVTHLRQVPQAQLIVQPSKDDEERDVSGDLHVVERRARALIEGAAAGTAPEQAVAQRCDTIQFLCRVPLAVWASHRPLLSAPL